MIHVPGAGFCDDQLPVLSTIGRGPVGPEGPKGDKGDPVEPTFADPLEWDDDRSYAAYTIVLHDGDSYTSKVAVPVGISLSDEDYWVHTGDYNAQVEKLSEKIHGNFCGARVACIGDSWLDGYTGGGATYSWADFLRSTGYFHSVIDYAKGGSGFYKTADNINFNTLAQQLVSQHGADQDIDLIVVVGGVNDLNQTDTDIASGVTTLLTTLKNGFPNVPIFVGCNNTAGINVPNLTKLRKILVKAEINGAIPINGLQNVMTGIFEHFTADSYHLDRTGYRFFAANILNYVQCGNLLKASYYVSLNSSEYVSAVGSATVNSFRLYKEDSQSVTIKFEISVPNGTASASAVATINDQRLQYLLNCAFNANQPKMVGNFTPLTTYAEHSFLGYDKLVRPFSFVYNSSAHEIRTGQAQQASLSLAVEIAVTLDLNYIDGLNDVSLFQ